MNLSPFDLTAFIGYFVVVAIVAVVVSRREKVAADYKAGLLTVSLGKLEEVKPKEIEVKIS